MDLPTYPRKLRSGGTLFFPKFVMGSHPQQRNSEYRVWTREKPDSFEGHSVGPVQERTDGDADKWRNLAKSHIDESTDDDTDGPDDLEYHYFETKEEAARFKRSVRFQTKTSKHMQMEEDERLFSDEIVVILHGLFDVLKGASPEFIATGHNEFVSQIVKLMFARLPALATSPPLDMDAPSTKPFVEWTPENSTCRSTADVNTLKQVVSLLKRFILEGSNTAFAEMSKLVLPHELRSKAAEIRKRLREEKQQQIQQTVESLPRQVRLMYQIDWNDGWVTRNSLQPGWDKRAPSYTSKNACINIINLALNAPLLRGCGWHMCDGLNVTVVNNDGVPCSTNYALADVYHIHDFVRALRTNSLFQEFARGNYHTFFVWTPMWLPIPQKELRYDQFFSMLVKFALAKRTIETFLLLFVSGTDSHFMDPDTMHWTLVRPGRSTVFYSPDGFPTELDTTQSLNDEFVLSNASPSAQSAPVSLDPHLSSPDAKRSREADDAEPAAKRRGSRC
jgi:hypothetical protein